MKNVLIVALLTFYFNVFSQNINEVLISSKNEQFISLKYSTENKLLFLTTSTGKMIILDQDEDIVDTIDFSRIRTHNFDNEIVEFKRIGTVDLDEEGDLGAFSDDEFNVYIFNQRSLRITDTIKLTTKIREGGLRVIFTKNDIYLSTFINVYKYTQDNELINIAPSYSVLDYNYKTDQLLLGYWDKKMLTDRKIKKLYLSSSAHINKKKHVLTIDNSFELYSYLTNEGNNVVSLDGKNNYYNLNLISNKKKIIIQESTNVNNKTSGLAKLNDSTTMVVVSYPLGFMFETSSDKNFIKLLKVNNSIFNNQIIDTGNGLYYITSGGKGNKLISIK